MNGKERKRHEKRKSMRAATAECHREVGENETTHIYMAPEGTATVDIVRGLIKQCDPSGPLLVVIEGEEGDVVGVFSVEERKRIEEQDATFKGKLLARMTQEQARVLGIL